MFFQSLLATEKHGAALQMEVHWLQNTYCWLQDCIQLQGCCRIAFNYRDETDHLDSPQDGAFYKWNPHKAVPTRNGWLVQIRQRRNPTKQPVKTTETYFPRMLSKVTEFLTIQQYIEYLQSLAGLNLNITIDVGTALNAFKFLRNGLEKYQNVAIHLGDFYFTKQNFQVTCLCKNRNYIQKWIFSVSQIAYSQMLC